MKTYLTIVSVALILFSCSFASESQAALTTIGTATYGGVDYKLIWDNNENSVVWLDYSNSATTWAAQNAWAAGLNAELTYNIDAAYTVDWSDTGWRLPDTVDGPYEYWYDGTTTAGYNITTSEMGHLYYEEFGNLGLMDTSGNLPPPGWILQNTNGDFDNILWFTSWYWSGTEYTDSSNYAWRFSMGYGYQDIISKGDSGYGLAVRSGKVSALPVPGAIWLLGSAVTVLIGYGRRKH